MAAHPSYYEYRDRLAKEAMTAAAVGGHTCIFGPSFGPSAPCPACAAIVAGWAVAEGKRATCKTCWWWGREYACACAFIGTTLAEQSATLFIRIEATAADDTNLEAHLYTGPDFGCIHHEDRS